MSQAIGEMYLYSNFLLHFMIDVNEDAWKFLLFSENKFALSIINTLNAG